jgi:hypothetical protein
VTRNDVLWASIVQKLSIDLRAPLTVLSEGQLKDALTGSRRDLRNLVSMTSEGQWATVLQDAGVFVLPKSRTEWMLVHGRGYEPLKYPAETEDFPSHQTIPLTTLAYGHSENTYLNLAYHSGLLSHFSGTATIYETVSGRSGTTGFRFWVDGARNLEVVEGTQMDVDKGYESVESVLLFEAKARPQSSFLIRQLYYPFRSHRDFQERNGMAKRVRPFFFVADPDDSTFTIWEFEWPESSVESYEAIQPKGGPRRYRITQEDVPKDKFLEIPRDRSIPEIQANDLEKVTSLPFLIPQGVDTAAKWAKHYGFALRQGNYYQAAAAALGLVRSEEGTFVLTGDGKRFVTLSPPERDEMTAERLLRVPTINRVFLLAKERGEDGVGPSEVARVIEESQGLRGKTPARRASTVLSWFKWLGQATGTIVVDGGRIFSRGAWESRPRQVTGG